MIPDKLKTRLSMDRPMVSVTLRMPQEVVDSLKAIAPLKGMTGYQALLKAYVSGATPRRGRTPAGPGRASGRSLAQARRARRSDRASGARRSLTRPESVRNLFDQYKAPENRLTHALACALDADRALLGRFVEWACGKRIDLRGAELRQQSFPGQRQELREVDAQEAERCGIPDACISTPDGWALLIESKFAAADSADQLQRHLRTARKYGLTSPSLLLLTAREPRDEHVPGIDQRRWRDLYRMDEGLRSRV